jgi:hypothetical protein
MRAHSCLLLAGFAAGLLGTASVGHAAVPAGISGKIVLPLSLTFLTTPVTTFTSAYSSLRCTLTLSSDDAFTKQDSVTVPATVAGKGATCNLSMNYQWHVANPKSHMTIAYTISAEAVSALGAVTRERLASGTVDIITLPANGATTTYKTVPLTL